MRLVCSWCKVSLTIRQFTTMFEQHLQQLQVRLADAGIDVAVISDDDSVYYYSGYYDYLHMEFGRPTLLLVARDGPSLLITPAIDENMALEHARVDRIEAWNDGLGREWREHIPVLLRGANRVAIEMQHMPAPVRAFIDTLVDADSLVDLAPIVAAMRMIKSEPELQLARHAGAVANAIDFVQQVT